MKRLFKPPYLLSRQRPDLAAGAPLIGARAQSRTVAPPVSSPAPDREPRD